LLNKYLEKAEDCFDDYPVRHGAVRGIMRRHKSPAANRPLGAFIKTQPDSLDDANLRSAPVGAN
jgi:hypothetical protein